MPGSCIGVVDGGCTELTGVIGEEDIVCCDVAESAGLGVRAGYAADEGADLAEKSSRVDCVAGQRITDRTSRYIQTIQTVSRRTGMTQIITPQEIIIRLVTFPAGGQRRTVDTFHEGADIAVKGYRVDEAVLGGVAVGARARGIFVVACCIVARLAGCQGGAS